ncbi:cytochrome b/b6 domain-containing protein [Tabrizicola sp.]|uniref:cytochrome b/b6 domain-containing protein n=1 Tax=Tabrizicola sp. TaxID=2005166 RepID=UPI00273367AA|nr:cytochrome b/b6 domain-containing protein [Tabrizicola sp.]MDP3194815.1 cytochrome b/b6 domain-containing protein [Tabrizicola sp.]
MATPRTTAAPPSLWDPVVRITHWGIAVSVLVNAALDEGGSLLHVSLGWLVLALLVLRLVWGVLGPREARFSAFPPNPVAALRHVRQLASGRVRHYPSHNPAGALMAYAFWACLALVTVTGLVMTGGATPMQVADDKAAVASGDWSALIRESEGESSEDGDNSLRHTAEEVHEVVANLLLILAALHVVGVFVEARALRRSLVAPMVLGQRRK